MIKKLYIIFFLCLFMTSCGKKGDPVYNKEDKVSKNLNTKMTMVL